MVYLTTLASNDRLISGKGTEGSDGGLNLGAIPEFPGVTEENHEWLQASMSPG